MTEMKDILKAQRENLGTSGKIDLGATMGRGGSVGMGSVRYGRGRDGQYRHGPGTGGDPSGAFNPRAPDKPGMYRPEYKLSAADLDDYVVGTVAGEAVTSNPESIDAVVNNMMNRLGTKGWGPSGNLHDVASAPGQYAGHRRATAEEAERIRARIRAIASGGVPDNTGGSNSYRAAGYNGPWARQHAADGRVVGGNRFAYEPGVPNGPYAPYKAPHGAPTASTSSSKPVTDSEVMAARQRIASGVGSQADQATEQRYRAEQAAPAPTGTFGTAKRFLRWAGKGSNVADPADAPITTVDRRDPRFAPHPVTVEHGVRHILKALADARKLTAGHASAPVPVDVTESSATKIGEHTGRAMLGDRSRAAVRARSDATMRKIFGANLEHPAVAYHRELMAGLESNHLTHTVNNVDRSSASTINGGVHVHTAATDAKGIASDLEPYLRQGGRVAQSNTGLA